MRPGEPEPDYYPPAPDGIKLFFALQEKGFECPYPREGK